MRVAALYDVHGNLPALEAVVASAVAAIRGVGSTTRDELIRWLLEPPDPDDVTAYGESTRGA